MKHLHIYISVLAVTLSVNALAQTDLDAFRYSQNSITGTARYTAMGGAFGALGGDFSTLATNPGGIGIYRTSEISFSPSFYSGNTTSNFIGSKSSDSRFNFNFGNAGLIYTDRLTNNEESSGWKNWNFGIGYNRLNNFHNRSYYESLNPDNSMTEYFAQNAQGKDYSELDSYYEYLAYYTYLINPDSSNFYSAAAPAGNIVQRRSSETRGSMGEVDITFGGNYSNKLYIGGSMGFGTIRYIEESTYEELDQENTIDSLDRFEFDQYLNTHGYGFNFKFGMIYRPNDLVRLGMAVHTPTWYSMHDEYSNTMRSRFDGGYTGYSESPYGVYDYSLTTPFKAIGSLAFIFHQAGLLSVDYEYSDYSQSRLDADGYNFTDVNNIIRKKYTAVHTIRAGAEARYGDFSFRAGGSMSTSPLNSQYAAGGADYKKWSAGGGIGMRDKNFFLDLAYLYSHSNEFFQPYTLENQDVPGVKNSVSSHNIVITLGAKF
ncbi:MAG: hypothetical protein IT242_03570 [Bacteroidia bacterium]|nr:hypothetical protein [Bacteroidia bacterium]